MIQSNKRKWNQEISRVCGLHRKKTEATCWPSGTYRWPGPHDFAWNVQRPAETLRHAGAHVPGKHADACDSRRCMVWPTVTFHSFQGPSAPANLFQPSTCQAGTSFNRTVIISVISLKSLHSLHRLQPWRPMMSSHTSSSRAWWERTLCKRIGFRVRTASGACPPLSRRISTTRARMWASGFLALVTFTMADTSITWSVQGNRSGKGGQGSLLSFVSLSSSPSWSRSTWSSCSKSSLFGACLSLATKWKETSKDGPFDSEPSAEAAKAAAKANPSVGAPSPLSFSKGFVLWVCTFRARGTSPARARLVKFIGSVQVESVLQITPAKFGQPLQYYHVLMYYLTVALGSAQYGGLQPMKAGLKCSDLFPRSFWPASQLSQQHASVRVARTLKRMPQKCEELCAWVDWNMLKHIETREISWWSWRSWSDIVVDGLRWTFPNTPAPSLTPEWRPGLRTLLRIPTIMAQSWLKTSENPLGVQVWSLSSLIFIHLLCLVSAEGLRCGASSQNITRSQSRKVAMHFLNASGPPFQTIWKRSGHTSLCRSWKAHSWKKVFPRTFLTEGTWHEQQPLIVMGIAWDSHAPMGIRWIEGLLLTLPLQMPEENSSRNFPLRNNSLNM